ncbi:hypothetical protein A4G19_08420 [Pasteurellaceae bacterium Macca]|nr:hypothetical protein [Pasteurellaceae bacterium Macca]
MIFFDSSLIIEQIKNLEGIKSDKDLAQICGVPTSTLSNWKNRNAFPLSVILNFSEKHNVSLDWLITGQDKHSLDAMQQLVLTAFNSLEDKKKLEAIAFMTGLGSNSQSNGQTVHGNVQNLVGRDVTINK